MQLRKIRVKNFRNFRELIIDPCPTPAVIVGENGVGKSNLLYALRLVLDPSLSDRRRHLEPDDIFDGAQSFQEGVEVEVEVELTDFDDESEARSELDGAIIAIDPLVARLTYLFRPKVSLGVVLGKPYARPLTPKDYEWTIFGAVDRANAMLATKQYASLSVLPALRDAESDLARPDRSPLMRLLREMPPEDSNIEKALGSMNTARTELSADPNVQKLGRLLSDRVSEMSSPNLDIDLTLAFGGKPEDLLRSLRLFIDPSASRGVERTSTGTSNVIYLALLLEHLGIRRSVQDGEDALLAVEEPEAHLHPTLQRRLFTHLLNEPNRLMLTTHSPHIAAVTPLSSLVLLSVEGDARARVVPPGLLDSNQAADVERYLNVTRAEMLFARSIILVEGTAESYVLPAIAASAGFDLDRHGVVLAAVDGTDFSPYARLLGSKALDRSFAVLTDGDPEKYKKAPEQGLMRGAQLLTERTTFDHDSFVARLPVQGEEDWEPMEADARRAAVSELSDHQVYVGPRTLEVDLAPLFAGELAAAFGELVASAKRRSNYSDAVNAIVQYGADADREDKLVSRVDRIGKGRYAQRLADHLIKVDLQDRVRTALSVAPESEIGREELLSVPGIGHILLLLHDIRVLAEELPLLPTPQQERDRYPSKQAATVDSE